MSLGLTKPGASVALRHPKTGVLIEPIGYLKNGKAVWPAIGASSDDPDDPAFTGSGGPGVGKATDQDDDEDDDLDEDDEEEKPKPKPKSKAKDDEDDEDERPSRPERQAARYRTRLREAEARERDLQERLRKLEDNGKPTDELTKRDLEETRERADSLTEVNRILTSQLAFFKANTITWADANDAFNLAEKEGIFDDLIDEDGNVDARELRRCLKDLAKRKPHLVKVESTRGRAKDEDDEDEKDEPSSRSSGSTMNSTRRGSKNPASDRAGLAKRFPVLKGR